MADIDRDFLASSGLQFPDVAYGDTNAAKYGGAGLGDLETR